MAFAKTGRMATVHGVSQKRWENVRVASTSGTLTPNLVEQASDILGQKFDPDNFLLSHATIVCSVDTMEVPGVKTGSFQESGFQINRKYKNFRITPETDKFTNNNLDSWSREVIKKSYRTFVGAHNFVEHVQIEDLSKGRILDAVARDIGPSIYVDILVATDRKHRDLVASIQSGEMGTLSMGCSVLETTCTQCGHVAVDETEMCSHVKYAKGNYFYDEQGNRHRIAELCGHETVDETGGVTFIEASWVKVPAFAGAVLRNVIDPGDLSYDGIKRAQEILSSPPTQWTDDKLFQIMKAASVLTTLRKAQFDFGDEGEDGETPEEDKSIFDDLEKDVLDFTLRRVKKQIKDEISGGESAGPEEPSTDGEPISPNENVIKQGYTIEIYKQGLHNLAKTASSDGQLIQGLVFYNRAFGVHLPRYIYETSLKVGSTDRYRSLGHFIKACQKQLGRVPSFEESRTLIRIGKLLESRSHKGVQR